jgi:hypothetical protein
MLTLKFVALLPLTATVAGTEQTALAGAPAHVNEAVPLVPPPPIESTYVALEPALTCAEFELPDATPNPRPGAVPSPDSGTDCGLSLALSVNIKAPVAEPAAVGANVTLIVQDPPAPTEVPQSFVSEYGLAA